MSKSSTTSAPTRRLPAGTRIAAVVSSYHREIGEQMLESARAVLEAAGLDAQALRVESAPGAFELPLLAQALAERSDVDAVLCFGLVLRGETSHNEHVARAAADGILRVGLELRKPVLFGVLTCDDVAQARTRSLRACEGGLDKGAEVAHAAIAALEALRGIRAPASRERARSRATSAATRSAATTSSPLTAASSVGARARGVAGSLTRAASPTRTTAPTRAASAHSSRRSRKGSV